MVLVVRARNEVGGDAAQARGDLVPEISRSTIGRRIPLALSAIVLLAIIAPSPPVTALSNAHPSPANAIKRWTTGASWVQFNPNQQRETSNYVLTSPHLHLIFWGSLWANATTKDSGGIYTNAQARSILFDLFSAIGNSPWADTVTQYCQGGGIGQGSTSCNANSSYITNPLSLDAIVDTVNAVPSTITQTATDQEAQWAYGQENNDINAVYMIFTPSGVGWSLGNGCAWHTWRTATPLVSYSVVPYAPDAGTSCYQNDVNPLVNDASTGGYGDGWFDGLTIGAIHEYAENVTDPYFGGWYDPSGTMGEIGDKCYPGLNEMFSRGGLVYYNVPLGNIWLGSHDFAIQGLWSNADGSCVLPFDNKDHLYLLDGYGGIHPSGPAPTLASPDFLGYDIGRGLAFFGGASGGYWMDGFGHLHPVGRVASPSLLDRPGFSIDIARSIWPAPWGTPNWPAGYILDGYGGINHFVRGPGPAPAIASPHYTSGVDIARALVINPDTYGQNPISGYMLDGYGKMWPFGGALAVTYPTFSFDIARGVTLLPKTSEFNPGGYILDGYGGMHPFGIAPALTNSPYFGFDIARGVTSWTFASTSWRYYPTFDVGGWIVDGYGGLHYYQSAPSVSSNVYWQNWDIARADTGSSSGSGAK